MELEQCVHLLRAQFGSAQLLSGQEEKVVVRLRRPEHGDSVVAKLWKYRPLAGALRRTVRMTAGDREWRTALRAARAGVQVAQPLGRATLRPHLAGHTDVLFMEDLGDCELSTDHLKRLIRSGDEELAVQLEDTLIDMTVRILAAGIIDVDHGMANVVVQKSGRPVRIDFEFAQYVVWPTLPVFTASYGEMVGRLIGLHAFAVQPDTARNTRFAARLQARLGPSAQVLERAANFAAKMMRRQLQETGINTHLRLPWVR